MQAQMWVHKLTDRELENRSDASTKSRDWGGLGVGSCKKWANWWSKSGSWDWVLLCIILFVFVLGSVSGQLRLETYRNRGQSLMPFESAYRY